MCISCENTVWMMMVEAIWEIRGQEDVKNVKEG